MPKVVTINEIALAGINAKDVDIARDVLAKTYANLCNHLGETNV